MNSLVLLVALILGLSDYARGCGECNLVATNAMELRIGSTKGKVSQ